MRTDDGCIIHECLGGESEAFGVLVDKYKGGIYAFAYAKLGNFQDAQDVTQEAFLKAYRNLRSLRQWESFGFWLYRIAYNLCREWIKARARRPDREFIEDQDPRTLASSSLDSHREYQLDESVQDALDSLSEAYREVLMLHYFGGMNSKEIAQVLGTSPTAVRMRLSRARAQLREEMVAMMDTAFEGHKLQASFTFRIVEGVKRIKINPMPRMTALPWGLSLAAGIMIAVLSIGPHLDILIPASPPAGSAPLSPARVLKTGEIPVDILRISQTPIISSKQGDGNGGEPQFMNQQNVLLAPHSEGDTWESKADMTMAKADMGASVVDGKIYIIGGQKRFLDNNSLATVEVYDPVIDKWDKKADMPSPRWKVCTSVVNGKIYAIGGWAGNAGGFAHKTVEVYNPATDTWTKKADMPTARCAFTTSAVNGKIYAIGGWDKGKGTFSTVEEYDPVTDTWTKKANMSTKKSDMDSVVVDGKIYIFGGLDNGDNCLTTVEVYDIATDTWEKRADMEVRVGCYSAEVVNGKVYLIGGGNDNVANFATVLEYDPAIDVWTKKTDMPTPRSNLATGVVNGRIYAIGGYTDEEGNQSVAIVEEYTPEGWQPEVVSPQDKLPTKWGEIKSR